MKIKTFRLVFCPVIFLMNIISVIAQPPCATNPIAEDFCINATPICNLNGYCGNTSAFYTATVSPTNSTNENYAPLGNVFCGGIQNNSWLKFIADSTIAVFNVWVNNCSYNHGIQMQIYATTDCYNFTAVSNCWNPGHPTNGQIYATGLVPGNVYFFMIDGNSNDICDYVISCDVGVNLSPAVTPNQTICAGDTTTIVASGGIGYIWTSNPPDPSLSSQQTNSAITVAPSTATTYSVTVLNPGLNTFCTTDSTILSSAVTINNVTPQLINILPEYCGQNNGLITVTGTGSNGSYSYLWNTTPAQTSASISGLSSGNYTVTVTSDGCHKTASYFVQEIAPPALSVASVSNNYCNQLNGNASVQVSGGTPPFSYLWNSVPQQNTYNLQNVSGGIYTVTVTDTANCSAIQTVTVTDVPGPTVTLASIPNICINNDTLSLSGGNPAGGTYSGTAVTNNIFDPAAAGIGSFLITYTYTDIHNCTDSASQPINVLNSSPVTFPQMTALCANAQPVTLNVATPPGGTYSGIGVSNGMFNPVTSGVGSFVITYTYVAPNGCSSSATQNMAVFPPPNVALAAFTGVCISSQPVALTGGNPAGGTYSGLGVNSGYFDPAITGVGTFNITYSYTNPYGCVNTASKPIIVHPLPVITLNPLQGVCVNAVPFLLQGGSPLGGTFSGTGVSNNTFNPSLAGTGYTQVVYSFIDSLGCESSDTQNILVNALPTAAFLPLFSEICVNGDSVLLSGGAPAGGIYVGPGVIEGVFYPSVAGADTVNIGYAWSDSIGCSDTAYKPILVRPLPNVIFLPIHTLCLNDNILTLEGGNPAGGSYSGPGVSNGMFDPVSNGVGVFPVIYSYTDQYGCTNDTTHQDIIVNSLPDSYLLNGGGVVCDGTGGLPVGLDSSQVGVEYTLLVNGLIQGFPYFGTGSAISFGNKETAGFYTITAFDTATGCSNIMMDTVELTLLPFPLVKLGDTMYLCDLPEIVLDGGTYYDSVTYLWQDGSSNRHFSVTEPGYYWVKVFQGNCFGIDSVDVQDCSELEFPNVFTPNADQKNDRFLPKKIGEILDYKIEIFNRWGNVVYVSTKLEEGWDGNNYNNGDECSEGVYFYVATYLTVIFPQSDRKRKLSGTATLLR